MPSFTNPRTLAIMAATTMGVMFALNMAKNTRPVEMMLGPVKSSLPSSGVWA